MSEETLRNELLHAAKLDGKHRGEIAELAFMRKAATLGFAVAKPWGKATVTMLFSAPAGSFGAFK